MDVREQRGRELAERVHIKRRGDLYVVPSGSGGATYTVDLAAPDGATCTCVDFESLRIKCKHAHAVEFSLLAGDAPDDEDQPAPAPPAGPAPAREPRRRSQTPVDWPAYNAAATTERGHFAELLAALCRNVEQPAQVMGRPRHPISDVAFALVWRAYSGKSLRRVLPELNEWRERGYVETVPHFNTLATADRRPETVATLRALVGESAAPLRAVEMEVAADSTGFSTSRFARWYDAKWGRDRVAREWVKLHLMIGVKTHVVTAVEVTRGYGNDTSDARQLPALVKTTARRFAVEQVSADKAYLSHKNIAAIAAVGATPFIPFKVNSTEGGRSSLWRNLFHYFQCRQDEFMAHYHTRSQIESAIGALKAKMGDCVRAKSEMAQVNTALCKVVAHNLCCLVASIYELGIDPRFYTSEAVQ